MESRFASFSVIVTGGGTGIGQATAIRFATEGARVFVTGRTKETLDDTVKRITDGGGAATAVPADVTDPGAADDVFSTVREQTGRLDVLVNNAGIFDEALFPDIELANWERAIAVNLTGPMLYAQRAARIMMDSGRGGSIINIGSLSGQFAERLYTSYNAAKAGLHAMTQTMAVELGRFGIRVNTVSPGPVLTPMAIDWLGPAVTEYMRTRLERSPINRALRPEEIAAVCAFLASEDASGIQGADIFVDGGVMANCYFDETLPTPEQASAVLAQT
jgi:NAD(P)-dependent dehydrogenase (short-subunit alcohol dehydrogenase family)